MRSPFAEVHPVATQLNVLLWHIPVVHGTGLVAPGDTVYTEVEVVLCVVVVNVLAAVVAPVRPVLFLPRVVLGPLIKRLIGGGLEENARYRELIKPHLHRHTRTHRLRTPLL